MMLTVLNGSRCATGLRCYGFAIHGFCGGSTIHRTDWGEMDIHSRYVITKVNDNPDLWAVVFNGKDFKGDVYTWQDSWKQDPGLEQAIAEEKQRLERLVAADFLEERGFYLAASYLRGPVCYTGKHEADYSDFNTILSHHPVNRLRVFYQEQP